MGINGASRTLIYDASGNPLFTASNPAAVSLTGSNGQQVAVTPEGLLKVLADLNGATINATLGDQQAKTTTIILQNAATAIGAGTPFTVGAYKTLTLSITGTSTSRTIAFEVSDADGNWTPIQGVRLSDFTLDTQTSTTGEKWTFEITGTTAFRANLVAISGGNITVKGTAVA